MGAQLGKLEQQAVRRHQEVLSARAGYDVGYEHALADWMENHAIRWREERQAKMLAAEREEIMKHKWIESEKARRDLGKEATIDWIVRYAAQWRAWYQENEEKGLT